VVAVEIRERIRRAAGLERSVWEALVDRYRRLVWGILRQVQGLGQAGREDLFQEVFLTLAKGALDQFHGDTEWEFRAFLRTITANKIRDYQRAQARRREVPEEDTGCARPDPTWLTPESQDPEKAATMRQLLDQAVRCLQELTDLDRQIFLRRAEGYPYDEIAAVFDLPQGTVASKHFRAKAKVEDCMRRAGVLEAGS